MKIIIPFITLFTICCLTSCQTDYNKSTKYSMEYAHDYDHDHDDHSGHNHTSGDNGVVVDENEDIYRSSSNRNSWQHPEAIRYHLGASKDKVLADIGAGPYGYFTFDFTQNTNFKKILALDIDKEALDFINSQKSKLLPKESAVIETRLVDTDDPKIKENEVDVVLIANTLLYIEDRLTYLSNLKKGIKKGGRLVIVDYKMKRIPAAFPEREERIPLYEMEALVQEAGYNRLISDDFNLPYQYVVVCENP